MIDKKINKSLEKIIHEYIEDEKTYNYFIIETVMNRIYEKTVTKKIFKNIIDEILHGGLYSGVIPELIYHTDYIDVFNKYEDEINSMIEEIIDNFGSKNLIEFLYENCKNLDNIYDIDSFKEYMVVLTFEEQINQLQELLEN